MPRISVELTPRAYDRLCQEAVKQRRPIPWEAEVRLNRSLRVPRLPVGEAPAVKATRKAAQP